ncbi:MAG: methylaspartate mutase subunit S [Defluviitaleaceae bacterium]|nr:methylaspartate mutase subunit S [Defluviitaleaceae bacterium]
MEMNVKTHDSEQDQITIVLGVIGADVHAVGNKILNYIFGKAGFNVVNLGVMASQQEFVEAALESDAKAIVVSSLYGHGEIDCKGLREKCEEAGLAGIKLYVGGNLVVGKQDFSMVEKTFLDMGFDRVYPPGSDPQINVAHMKEDFGIL